MKRINFKKTYNEIKAMIYLGFVASFIGIFYGFLYLGIYPNEYALGSLIAAFITNIYFVLFVMVREINKVIEGMSTK